jgi:hypothetical protein
MLSSSDNSRQNLLGFALEIKAPVRNFEEKKKQKLSLGDSDLGCG